MDTIDIVIETTAGSKAKYKFYKKSQHLKVKKLLPAGMVFPYDFGFIPGTKGEDGDPIDAMVIAEFSTFPGCHIDCRLIGAILAEQTEGTETVRNDRYIFIPEVSLFFHEIVSLNQLSGDHLEQLTEFFINYNRAEKKEFRPLEIVDADKAWKLLKKQQE